MKIARVIGNVVSTIKHESFNGLKLLLVQPLDLSRKPTGRVIVAADGIGAGSGEEVLLLDEGTGSGEVLNVSQAPIRATVVGIIDEVKLAKPL